MIIYVVINIEKLQFGKNCKNNSKSIMFSFHHPLITTTTKLSLPSHLHPSLQSSPMRRSPISAGSYTEIENDGEVELSMPPGLRREAMPRHVAMIMDGNMRWAKQKGLPGSAGHVAGVKSLTKVVELCIKWGIKVLTVFGFSIDNWLRSKVGNFLFSYLQYTILASISSQ